MKRYIFPLTICAIVAVAAVLVYSVDMHSAGIIAGVLAANAPPVPATVESLDAAIKALAETNDNVKKFAETAEKEMKENGKLTEELRGSVDGALTKMTALAGQIGDIEQRLARANRERGQAAADTAGKLFVESDAIKNYKGGRGTFRVGVPRDTLSFRSQAELNAAITSLDTSAGKALNPYIIPGIVELPRRRLFLRNLIAAGRTNTAAFKYVKESGFTNNAAVVSETAQKPYSDLTFDSMTGNVSTIAHLMKASKQILADLPALQSTIDARMRYGLQLAEEAEMLLGDGTGEHLLGIIPQASDYAASFSVSNTTRIDVIRLALLQVYLAQFPADGIVMHPIDWAHIELSKDSLGRYLIGNPQGNIGATLWGLPVVETLGMTSGDFLVGAFQLGAQVLDREDAAVEVSTENDKDFEKNMVTIRAEERLALPVYRPEAFVTGTFASATG